MRKVLTATMAALTLGGAVMATAAPAEARPNGYYSNGRYYDRRDNNHGDAAIAGIVGLALGAALASGNNNSRSSYGYYDRGYGYYDSPRYYRQPRVCESKRWVYDPYIGRDVRVRERYRC